MRINESSWDRAVRVVVGLGLLATTLAGPHTLWGVVGAIPLLTGLTGYCPLYQLIGLATRPAGARAK